MGIQIVGNIPAGLPDVKIPNLSDFELIKQILPSALTIALIAFMESISVAKAIEEKHNDYSIVPNQEMIALGASNIIGSIFSSYPVTGGFSRSALNDQAGAKTGISSLVSAILIFFTLLFLTDYFYYLPKTILASIILVAVYGLIDFKTPFQIFKTSRLEFIIYILTLFSTLILGIQHGIAIGVLLSLLVIIYHVSYPHIAELGRLPDEKTYMNIDRYLNAELDAGILIIRFDARLFYANMDYFKSRITYYFEKRTDDINCIIISSKSMNDIDYSGLKQLEELIKSYDDKGVKIYFSEIKGPVRDKFKRYGFTKKYGNSRFFLTIASAIQFHKTGVRNENEVITFQSND